MSGFATLPAEERALYFQQYQAKSLFFSSGWANYETACHGTFKLVPPPERIENLKRDYRAMEQMFFEAPPSFESILETLQEVEDAINIPST